MESEQSAQVNQVKQVNTKYVSVLNKLIQLFYDKFQEDDFTISDSDINKSDIKSIYLVPLTIALAQSGINIKKLTPFINNMSNQEYKSTILELIEEPVKLSPVDFIKLDDNIKMSDIKELYNNWTGPTKEFVAALELLESKQKSTPISYAKIVKNDHKYHQDDHHDQHEQDDQHDQDEEEDIYEPIDPLGSNYKSKYNYRTNYNPNHKSKPWKCLICQVECDKSMKHCHLQKKDGTYWTDFSHKWTDPCQCNKKKH